MRLTPLDVPRHIRGVLGPTHHSLARRRVGTIPASAIVAGCLLLIAAFAAYSAVRARLHAPHTPRVTVTALAQHVKAPPEAIVRGVALYSAVWQEAQRVTGTDSSRTARYFYLLTDGESAIPVASASDPYSTARDTAHVELRAAVRALPPELGAQLSSDSDVVQSFELVDTLHYLEPLRAARRGPPWVVIASAALALCALLFIGRVGLWTTFVPEPESGDRRREKGVRSTRERGASRRAGASSGARGGAPPSAHVGASGVNTRVAARTHARAPARVTGAFAIERGRPTRIALRGAHGAVRAEEAGAVIEVGVPARNVGLQRGRDETQTLTLTVPDGARVTAGRIYENLRTHPAVRVRAGRGSVYLTVDRPAERDAILQILRRARA
jgi:hypothetical protein